MHNRGRTNAWTRDVFLGERGGQKDGAVHLVGESVNRRKGNPEQRTSGEERQKRGEKEKWLNSGQKSKRPYPGVHCAPQNRPWNSCCAFSSWKFLFSTAPFRKRGSNEKSGIRWRAGRSVASPDRWSIARKTVESAWTKVGSKANSAFETLTPTANLFSHRNSQVLQVRTRN